MARFVQALVVVLVLGASSQAQVTIRHNPAYKVGDVITVNQEVKTQQTLKAGGLVLETKGRNFAVLKEEVIEAGDSGTRMRVKHESLQVQTDLPGGQQLAFDSGAERTPAGEGPIEDLRKMLQALMDIPYVVVMDGQGNVTGVEVDEQALVEVPEAYRKDLSAAQLKKQAITDRKRLPDGPVNPGDTWTRNEDSQLGGGQVFHVSREYTYQGREMHNGRELDHITYVTKEVQFEIEAGSQLPVEAKDSKLEVKSSDGRIWFDPQARRIVEQSDKLHVEGTLTLVAPAQGLEYHSELDLTLETSQAVQ